MKPYFSIVIPTKDRPECVEIVLGSIQKQNFEDYEVIISDNGFKKPCEDVVRSFGDSRLRYVRPQHPLGMSDSFEYAQRFSDGQWLMILGDKNILYHGALKKLALVLDNETPDILNFSLDFYSPFDTEKTLLEGKLKERKRSGRVEQIDCIQALKSHLSFRYLMASIDREWYLGCIYSGGVYRREFVDRIKRIHVSGRLFDGVVPDRYGAVEALTMADKVCWLDDNIIIYGIYKKNTWGSVQGKKESIQDFIYNSREGYDITRRLFCPKVIISVNNILATDFRDALENFGCCSTGDKLGKRKIGGKKMSQDQGYYGGLIPNRGGWRLLLSRKSIRVKS